MSERDEEKKKQRITVGLDDFDHKVVSTMAVNWDQERFLLIWVGF